MSQLRAHCVLITSRSHQVVSLAALTGVLTGVIVALFDRLVVDVLFEHVLKLRPWLIAILPATGLLLALVVRKTIGQGASPSTADEYLHAFHDEDHELEWRPFIARTIAGV